MFTSKSFVGVCNDNVALPFVFKINEESLILLLLPFVKIVEVDSDEETL